MGGRTTLGLGLHQQDGAALKTHIISVFSPQNTAKVALLQTVLGVSNCEPTVKTKHRIFMIYQACAEKLPLAEISRSGTLLHQRVTS